MTKIGVSQTAQYALNGLHILGAAAIGFFFLVIVMIATAQQDVLTRMKAEGLSVGYSSALVLRRDANAKLNELPKLLKNQLTLSANVDDAQAGLDQAQQQLETAWDALRANVGKLERLKLCDLSTTSMDDPNSRRAIAAEIQQCDADQTVGASNSRTLQAAKAEADQFRTISQKFLEASNRLTQLKRQLALIRNKLAADQTFSDDQQKAVRSFSDMDVLLQPWVLFGNDLVQFPPPLLQILLTFISGLFGALLVTMILIVYPNNLIVTSGDARPVTRTILGGFIAVCVYIVLLSGTAVIGSGNSGNGAGTNYMAFCGIGILAGMFSDRVAGWLSKRADEFFKQ